MEHNWLKWLQCCSLTLAVALFGSRITAQLGKQISFGLWNTKVEYCVPKNLPPLCLLSQLNPFIQSRSVSVLSKQCCQFSSYTYRFSSFRNLWSFSLSEFLWRCILIKQSEYAPVLHLISGNSL